MNHQWKSVLLREVCVIERHQALHSSLPFVGLEHIEAHTGRFIGSVIPQRVKSSTFRFSPDHVLVGRLRPYLNKVLLPDFIGHCSTEIFPLKPFSNLSRNFLRYWLMMDSVVEKIVATSTGARMPRANMNKVLEFKMPLPPISEQKRIVEFLDQAFEAIASAKTNARQNFQNARAIFASNLELQFAQPSKGWLENSLKSLTTKIGSGATPLGGGKSYKSEGISLIRSMNVYDFGFNYHKLAFLDNAQANELSNVEVRSRDVLLNITGASVARCCLVPDDALPARVNQHVAIIRPIESKLDSDFLHYLLISKRYKEKLLRTGEEGGSTRQAVTKTQIQDFIVKCPGIEEQRAIVCKLDGILSETRRLEMVYQRKLTELDGLKTSLLHEAFSGNL